GWISAERFHIDAKAPAKAEDTQLMPMLQTLLGERFKLAVHREKKDMTAYALVVAKGGPKMGPGTGDGSSSNSNHGKLTARNVSMSRFAEFVARQVGLPVADETKLSGGFDFSLEWSSERARQAAADSDTQSAPTMFTALPEQLGLKLEARKLSVDLVVIDRVE